MKYRTFTNLQIFQVDLFLSIFSKITEINNSIIEKYLYVLRSREIYHEYIKLLLNSNIFNQKQPPIEIEREYANFSTILW